MSTFLATVMMKQNYNQQWNSMLWKKRNVDLTVPMDLIFFVKEHDPPDGQILKIVCHLRPLLDQLLCLTIKSVSVICISWIHTKSRKNGLMPWRHVYQARQNSADVRILERRFKAKPPGNQGLINVRLVLQKLSCQ